MEIRRNHRAAACLVALAVLLSACNSSSTTVRLDKNGIPIGPISAQWMEKQPLSHLYYPGSKPFYLIDSGSDEGPHSGPAEAGAVLTSDATGSQIYSWYITTLKSMGWSFVTDKGCLDIQPSCPQFGHNGHSNRQGVTIAIDNPSLLPSVIGKSPPPDCTVYEVRYEIFPPGGLTVPSPMQFSGGNRCWWTATGWHRPSDVP
jgi:hypothetical protein